MPLPAGRNGPQEGPKRPPWGPRKALQKLSLFWLERDGHLGASWDPFGALLGPFLGPLGALFGLSWNHFKAIFRPLGLDIKAVSSSCQIGVTSMRNDIPSVLLRSHDNDGIATMSQHYHIGSKLISYRYHSAITLVEQGHRFGTTNV